MYAQTQIEDLLSDVELKLPVIVSKVEAVSQALFSAYINSDEICDEVQFYRGLHWILDDAVAEFKKIREQLSEDGDASLKVVSL